MSEPMRQAVSPCLGCVLVPIDGTEGTDRVVPAALSLGSTLRAPVRPVVMTTDRRVGSRAVDDLRARFPPLADPAIAGGPNTIDGLLAEAADRTGLVVAAAASGGRAARSGRRVARSLLGTTRRPVVLIGPEAHRPCSPARIVVPVDGTARGDELVTVALAWSAAHALGVHLVGVVRPDPSGPEHRRPTPGREFGRDPESHLAQLLAGHSPAGVAVTTQVVTAPIGVAREVGPLLRDSPQSLLMISSSSRRSRWPLARRDSATAIVRESPVPVLVVPPAPPAEIPATSPLTRG